MKLPPFLFCAYTADMAKQVTAVFERDSTLGCGWSIHQLPLTCLPLLCMYNESYGWQDLLLRTDIKDSSYRRDLCRLDFILSLALILTPRAESRHKAAWLKPEELPWEGSWTHQPMLKWCVWCALTEVINIQGTKMETKGMNKRKNHRYTKTGCIFHI